MGQLAIVFGGPSPEHGISILTGLLSERVLREAGQDVAPIYWTPTGDWVLCPPSSEAKDFLEGPPRGGTKLELGAGFQLPKKGLGGAKPLDLDAVLNCCHGGPGEGGGLNGLFDQLGIPATGGPAALAALGMDKLAFGAVLQAAGIPTLPRCPLSAVSFDGPFIVKPRFGGSSIGIEIVEDLASAQALAKSSRQLRQGAVVEPFSKSAVDLNLAYSTYPSLRTSLLEKPLAPSKVDGIYSYEQKYLQTDGLQAAPRELPAQVPDAVTKEAERLAAAVLDATGIKGLGRLDFLLVDDVLYVNEINTIPGSMSLYLWPPSISAAELLMGAVTEAKETYKAWQPAPFDHVAALRAAGGMAGKLGQIGRS